MRLGLLGGSFDPVHYGHLLLAECCREQCGLDEVWFLPAATPPHKQDRSLTSATERVEMLELATGGQPTFRVCRAEVERGGVSYTVDTLAKLAEEDASRQLFFLLGADSLDDSAALAQSQPGFAKWRQSSLWGARCATAKLFRARTVGHRETAGRNPATSGGNAPCGP